MGFDESFLKEETRCGFLVTEKRKKIWRTELELLARLDEVCKKYGLSYFAEYGTMLGAVRHHGFVPWDDDIDVMMFREDYMKLQEVAPTEFQEPYFFQNTYTDLVVWGFSKLRDDRTTGIEFADMSPDFHQGIFIDIKPFDDVPDGKDFGETILQVQREAWQTVANSQRMRYYVSEGVPFALGTDILEELLNLPVRERYREFEKLNLSYAGMSERVNFIVTAICKGLNSRKREWYRETIDLPFEYTTVPVPAGYDEILKIQYGDYHRFVPGGSLHEHTFFDPDVPYRYYMEHPEKMTDYEI